MVNADVCAPAIRLDEPVALLVTEPLHLTLSPDFPDEDPNSCTICHRLAA